MNFKKAIHSFRLVASFILLFAFTQTVGLLHSEIHPFHTHTAECDLYDQFAQPINETADSVAVLSTVWTSDIQPEFTLAELSLAAVPHFWGRAPPSA
ncbi:hypothetical protein [Thiomicrorhabdus sp.]|uniref:hypothetical protein n=1 Tax=Thiomicrorhabdus sp. TaxID=2039724 RepID=UPI0035664825